MLRILKLILMATPGVATTAKRRNGLIMCVLCTASVNQRLVRCDGNTHHDKWCSQSAFSTEHRYTFMLGSAVASQRRHSQNFMETILNRFLLSPHSFLVPLHIRSVCLSALRSICPLFTIPVHPPLAIHLTKAHSDSTCDVWMNAWIEWSQTKMTKKYFLQSRAPFSRVSARVWQMQEKEISNNFISDQRCVVGCYAIYSFYG